MGLFSKRVKNPVSGQAQVVSASGWGDGNSAYASCRMNLVVQAPGLPAYNVEHKQICPTSKWPFPGTTVPVTVSSSNPKRLRIEFDDLRTTDDRARDQAAQQAAMLRGEQPSDDSLGIVDVSEATTVQWVGGGPEDLTPEQRRRVEDLLGVDVDGDGVVGSAGVAPRPAAGAGADRIAQLERLARLRDSGALSAEEFEAEKTRLLRS